MGLRGIGARPLSKKRLRVVRAAAAGRQTKVRYKDCPWEKAGLSRAAKVIAFCEDLTVTSGELADTKLALRPWQKSFVRDVYEETKGGRAVRTAVLSMGRKNGKTQLAAALALCHLSGPEAEARGEVYACANDRFQASKIFNEMVAMINRHAYLRTRTNIIKFRRDIEDLSNGSVYSTLTAEAKTKMGLSPSFVVYDELGQATSRELYDTMDSAMGARKEPLLLVISTQAPDDLAPMSQLIDYGKRVNAGEVKDASFHLTFYTAPDDADPWDIKTWKLANPALDDFRSLSDVRRLASQAQRIPSQENAFRNLILNQRVAAETRFVEASVWKECGEPPNIPPGVPIYAGLDLGEARDLSALVIVWEDYGGIFHVKPYCWVPGDLRARADTDKTPYELWVKQGFIMHGGTTTDPELVARKIAEIHRDNKIQILAFDRWRMGEIKKELDRLGCTVALEPFGQGFKDMSPAVNVTEKLIVQKKLRHGNHPVLNMCVTNAVVVRDPAGGRKFDKSKSIGRIDALVAMSMGLAAATVRDNKPKVVDVASLIG